MQTLDSNPNVDVVAVVAILALDIANHANGDDGRVVNDHVDAIFDLVDHDVDGNRQFSLHLGDVDGCVLAMLLLNKMLSNWRVEADVASRLSDVVVVDLHVQFFDVDVLAV